MHTCVHMHVICLSAGRSQEKVSQEIVSHPMWVLGTKLGPSGRVESTVSLIVEPSLQPLFHSFCCSGRKSRLASLSPPFPFPPFPSSPLLFWYIFFKIGIHVLCTLAADSLCVWEWPPWFSDSLGSTSQARRLQVCAAPPRLCKAEDWGFVHVRQALL